MDAKTLLFEQSAVKETLKELSKLGYQWQNIKYINKNRYAIIYGNINIAILLKTEPFFNFGYKFARLGEKGVGDTINCNALKEFIQDNVKIIYLKFKDGRLYYITLEKFLNNSHKWIQKEGTEVRSISIHHYSRVNLC